MSKLALLILAAAIVGVFGEYPSYEVKSDVVKSYDGYQVLRITPKTWEQLSYLHDVAMTTTELDFWTYPSALNNTVDVMVSPLQRSSFVPELETRQIETKVWIPDVEAVNRAQRNEVSDVPSGFINEAVPRYFTAYQRLAAINNLMNTLASQNSAIARVESIGTSTGGRAINVIQIGTAGTSKPIIFVDSLIHAREWVTGATTMYLAQYLIDQYNANNATVRTLLTNYLFYIVPVVNPDGYEYTHTNERLWRKTRASNSGSTCVGTDPNRNWQYQWNPSLGGSTNPCSEIYSGASAANQPETKALQDYLYANRARIRVYIAVHSYSQLLLWAYGYTSANSPSHSVLSARGTTAIAALTPFYNTRYTLGTITNTLYAAAGNAVDYAFVTCGITLSYTIELRDTGSFGFQLPASQIVPSGIETTAFFLRLAQIADTE